MAYNCVSKSLDHRVYSRDFSPGAFHPFLAVKQTLGGRTFKDDSFKRSMADHNGQGLLSTWNGHIPRRCDKRYISCVNSIQLSMNCLSRTEKLTPACELQDCEF